MALWVEPVVLAINYAKTLGYKRIVLVGLSGGGWTPTVAAARITARKLQADARNQRNRSEPWYMMQATEKTVVR